MIVIRKFVRSRIVFLTIAIVAFGTMTWSAPADDKSVKAGQNNGPSPSPSPSAGLLHFPDYSADIWTGEYLTGDWGGARTDLANKGVQVGLNWTQFVQGVAEGGTRQVTEYGASVNLTINLDLMRMGVLPGALIRFRGESRYGSSVNGDPGTILPVNTTALSRSPPNSTT